MDGSFSGIRPRGQASGRIGKLRIGPKVASWGASMWRTKRLNGWVFTFHCFCDPSFAPVNASTLYLQKQSLLLWHDLTTRADKHCGNWTVFVAFLMIRKSKLTVSPYERSNHGSCGLSRTHSCTVVNARKKTPGCSKPYERCMRQVRRRDGGPHAPRIVLVTALKAIYSMPHFTLSTGI